MMAIETRQIPQLLTERDQWIIWKLEERDGRQTKVPYSARNSGAKASSTDPRTWAPFDAVRESPRIGYVLTAADGVAFIDLDHCVDQQTREIDAWAGVYVEEADTFTEFSQSGAGLHILAGGSLPGAGKHRKDEHGNGVEMYATERFIAITGAKVPGAPATIEPRQAFIDALYAQLADPPKRPTPAHEPLTCSDAEIVTKACANTTTGAEFTRLFAGDLADVGGDASRGEWKLIRALRFWTRADAGRMDAIYRSSGLRRDKWDSRRGDSTYGARTIAAALDKGGPLYDTGRVIFDAVSRNGHASGGSHDGNGNGAPDAPDGPEHYTDGGNGGFLAKRYGRDFRFVPGRGFFVWTGTRWARDLAEVRVQGLAQRAVRDLYQLAADEPDDGRRKALAAHAKSSDSAKSVRAMVTMARSAPGVLAESDTFDQHDGRFLFNAANGTVDLRTGRLRPHRRGDYLTKIADIIYDPKAECPLFMDFLYRIFSRNDGVIDYVRRAVGYSMTGDTGEKAMFLCHGDTDTGKSTFLEVIAHAMGEYGTVAAPSLLMETRNEQHLTRVAALAGTRYVTTIETDEGKRLNEAQVKHLTGSDRVTANYMHENMFTFVPSHKLWLATNHLPRVTGTGDAIWARLPVIKFTVRIHEADKDRQLGDKLKGEASGILAWMVRGAMAWAARGLQPPDEVRKATKAYRAQEDTLADFIAEQCVIREDLIVTVSDLYARYVSWAQAAGEKPQSKRAFGLKMDERGYPDGRYSGHRMRKGIGLRDFSGGGLPTVTPRYGGDA